MQVPRALEPGEKLDELRQLGVVAPGVRLLALRGDDPEFLGLLAAAGVDVHVVDSGIAAQGITELASDDLDTDRGRFDVCILFDSLGLNVDPLDCLDRAWRALRIGGLLVLASRRWTAGLPDSFAAPGSVSAPICLYFSGSVELSCSGQASTASSLLRDAS